MTNNEIIQERPFEKKMALYKEEIKDFFRRYKNKSGDEDCIEVCLIRAGYRTVLAAEEEINRQKAEIKRLEKEINSLAFNLIVSRASGKSSVLKIKIDEIKAEAYKEVIERLCEDRVSNDPVVIAAKCRLKELEGDTE